MADRLCVRLQSGIGGFDSLSWLKNIGVIIINIIFLHVKKLQVDFSNLTIKISRV